MLSLILLFFTVQARDVGMAGFDTSGTRDFPSDINKENVVSLHQKWNAALCGPASASPSIINGKVYVSDFGSCLSCFDLETGALLLRRNLTADYGFPSRVTARGTPTYYEDGNSLLLGTSAYVGSYVGILEPGYGSWLFSVNLTDLSLMWKVEVNDNVWSLITQSLTIRGNKVYFGVSSSEASAPLTAPGTCCSFVGKAYCYNANNGAQVWERAMIPDELAGVGKYSGCGIFGFAPVVVEDDVYFGTGQTHAVPDDVATCINNNPLNGSCYDSRVLFDSIVRINRFTGEIRSSFRASAADAWNIACYFNGMIPGCQTPSAAFDWDVTGISFSRKTNTLFAQAKSGFIWHFDRDLTPLHSSVLVLGSASGGYVWWPALRDNHRLGKIGFLGANNNGNSRLYTLPNGMNTTAGAWTKYNGLGELEWVTPGLTGKGVYGGVAITNNVVFGSTVDGVLAALDYDTGAILWTFPVYTGMYSGPSISEDTVVWTTGRQQFGDPNVVPRLLYGFSL